MLHVTAEQNERGFHAIPQEPKWQGETRYSFIFRTITRTVELSN